MLHYQLVLVLWVLCHLELAMHDIDLLDQELVLTSPAFVALAVLVTGQSQQVAIDFVQLLVQQLVGAGDVRDLHLELVDP